MLRVSISHFRIGAPYRLQMPESCLSVRLRSLKQNQPGIHRFYDLGSGTWKKYGGADFSRHRFTKGIAWGYRVKGRFVENAYENRFYLDAYGS